ncbi:hypothetical protein [Nocardioides limicola]|uniref:hypothetical protein n=1 Tax=Nocardioides limicola TaxID=2803368 RepID=UPI00193C0AAE|nr:hypothetical protein [Nocardioides sp. DJM-14]
MPHSPTAVPLPRRALLGGVVAVSSVAAVGCESVWRSPLGATEPTPTADEVLRQQVLAAVAGHREFLTAVVLAHPGLSGPLHRLATMHSAHARVLGEGLEQAGEVEEAAVTPTPDPAPDPVPRRSGAALRVVRRRHLAWQRQLADQVVAAESGGFARVLAAMAAAVTQQLLTLPQPESGAA